jgi:alkylation response protein AidB-like acyl-CoA dehydrogenase
MRGSSGKTVFVFELSDRQAFASEARSAGTAEKVVRASRFIQALNRFCDARGIVRDERPLLAIDVGIARAAIDDTITFVRESSRAWVDSGLEHAWQDPYTIQAVGDLKLRLHAAQALLDRAGLAVDRAVANPTAETVAEAQIAVAESKVFSTEVAIAATNKLFELAGSRSTLAEHNQPRQPASARLDLIRQLGAPLCESS